MKELKFASENEAIQYLSDFCDSKILIATEDWYNLPEDSDEMKSQVEALYELEYKYSQMKNNAGKFEGNPQRYDNIINKMGNLIIEISSDVANDLLEVFEEWLDKHALLSAKRWSKKRLEEAVEIGDNLWAAAEGEYQRYNGSGFNNKIMNKIGIEAKNMTELSQFLSEYGDEQRSYAEESAEEDEDYEMPDDDYFDDPFQMWMDFIEIGGEIENLPDYIQEEIVGFLYEHVVFPIWISHWKEEGIEETRKRVEKTTKNIGQVVKKSIKDPAKAISFVNIALNEAHQTGSMMDYIEGKHDISKSDLDELSNKDVGEWNKELNKIGLKV